MGAATPAPPMAVLPLASEHAAATRALLADLRMSAFGLSSARLHAALVEDALDGAIVCRVAPQSHRVAGVVLAAPASYWRSVFARHWALAIDCTRHRLASIVAERMRPHRREAAAVAGAPDGCPWISGQPPSRTWADPSDACRILFVGTAADARRQGIAGQLYRALMTDYSLVARIAADNRHSLALHHSLGWRLHRDGDVVLAVHDRAPQTTRSPPRRVAV